MTSKDYTLIANELKFQHEILGYSEGNITGNANGEPTETVYIMSCKLWAQTLKAVNANFDINKFLTECGVN